MKTYEKFLKMRPFNFFFFSLWYLVIRRNGERKQLDLKILHYSPVNFLLFTHNDEAVGCWINY